MEWINGCTLKAFLSAQQQQSVHEQSLKSIAHILRKMHAQHLIHGDLTTSNIMIRNRTPDAAGDIQKEDVVLVDWGLSSFSALIEDKAVDLYVLERAWISTHPTLEHAVNSSHFC